MIQVANFSDNDKRMLFRNTADKMGLNDAIVEKDFWVCFTLDYLFHRSPWKNSITFKGGTSLSKAFHLINRFSEDIDLILDWRILGYDKDEPLGESYYPATRSQQTGTSGDAPAVFQTLLRFVQYVRDLCKRSCVFPDRSVEEGCGLQNEVLSESMGEVPGGCARYFETGSSRIPVSGIRVGL